MKIDQKLANNIVPRFLGPPCTWSYAASCSQIKVNKLRNSTNIQSLTTKYAYVQKYWYLHKNARLPGRQFGFGWRHGDKVDGDTDAELLLRRVWIATQHRAAQMPRRIQQPTHITHYYLFV